MSLVSLGIHGVCSITEQVASYDDFHTTKILIKTEDTETELILYHKDKIIPLIKLPFKDTTQSLQSEST